MSKLQRLTLSMPECWDMLLARRRRSSIRDVVGIPQDATSDSVCLDGFMCCTLRPGEDGLRHGVPSARHRLRHRVSFHDADGKRLKTGIYFGRMPESGKLTLEAQLASEVAHIRRLRPEIGIVAIADGAADNWTFLESLSPEDRCDRLHGMLANFSQTGRPTMPWRPAGTRSAAEILRHELRGFAKWNQGAAPSSRCKQLLRHRAENER